MTIQGTWREEVGEERGKSRVKKEGWMGRG
jgi:hypothetical protein